MIDRVSRTITTAHSRWWTFIAVTVVIAFAHSLFARSIDLSDEGRLLSQVVEILNGKILYRDIDAFVTPGIWLLLAGLFKLVEPSVMASRILSVAVFLGTALVCYRIVASRSSRAWCWSTVGLLMIFSVWAFPASTIDLHSPVAILFALAALDRLLVWQAGRKSRDVLACGLFLGLSILFKQDYGVLAAAGSIVALGAFRLEVKEPTRARLMGFSRDSLLLAAGGIASVLPVAAYFAYHGALSPAFESLELLNRDAIAFPSFSLLWASIPFERGDLAPYTAYSFNQAADLLSTNSPVLSWLHTTHVLARMHILLFWIPVIALPVGALLALRPPGSRDTVDGSLVAVIAVAGFVFLGVFPRADFSHLINVYQPMIVAFVLVMHQLSKRMKHPSSIAARSGMVLGLTTLLLYAGVAGAWYLHTLRTMNVAIASPRAGVLVNASVSSLINNHVRSIQEQTSEGDFILTLPGLEMLNFLADRPIPGRYNAGNGHRPTDDGGASVVAALEEHGVDLVIVGGGDFPLNRIDLRADAPALVNYLRSHFEADFDVTGQNFQYLKRRDSPIESRMAFDLIDFCDIESHPATYVREQTLFASLYQDQPPDESHPTVPTFTQCTFTVPKRAQLAFSIGYRRPVSAEPDATLTAEVWLADGDSSEPLFAVKLPVEPHTTWSSPPAQEHRVNLVKYAGREISLLFRPQLTGSAEMRPFDRGEFSLIWQDLRIETRHDRVLLVGIDGATLRVIEPMIAEGRLPNLAAIAHLGASGPLRSAYPLLSPRIWTSIATGKIPQKHGINHWITNSEDGGVRLMLGTDRKVPAIWNIVSERGFTSGVINWLQSYPPEKIDGVVISDFAIAGQRQAREDLFAGKSEASAHVDEVVTYPAEWTEILEQLTTGEGPLLDHINPFDDNPALPSWLSQTIPSESFRDDDLITRIALEVEERVHPDLMLVYLSGIDKVSHHTWGALEPSEAYPAHIHFSDTERAATIAALEDYYAYTDELIGKLVERFGPNDLVMIVSDHGFEPQLLVEWLTGGHETENALDGVLFARGWRIAEGQEISETEITDITPTILAWLGLPSGNDMDGQVAGFVEIDSLTTIPSYDDITVERVADDGGEVDDSIMDQLRGLGYVE